MTSSHYLLQLMQVHAQPSEVLSFALATYQQLARAVGQLQLLHSQ
jgi:hypothetical protein